MLSNALDILQKKHNSISIIAYSNIPWLPGGISQYFWHHNSPHMNLYNFLSAMRLCSWVIWVGGTCFTDEEGDGGFRYMAFAKLFGKKIGYWSVGIGNLHSLARRIKARFLLASSSHVSFRDVYSRAHAKMLVPWKHLALNEITDDLALDILQSRNARLDSPKPYLVIAWRDLEVYLKQSNELIISNIIPKIVSIAKTHNIDVLQIIDTDSSVDSTVGKLIYQYLHQKYTHFEVIYNRTSDPYEKLSLIATSSVVFTARLHALVTADHYRIPCHVFAYSPKVTHFIHTTNNNMIYPVLIE